METLPGRVHLPQRWMDLLSLEGMNFGHDADYWQQQTGTDNPEYAHREFNRLLLAGDLPGACALIDSLLAHFDAFSRNWFADETPGNFRTEAWSPITSVERIRCGECEVLLSCWAGNAPVTLHLSCPATGEFACVPRPGSLRATSIHSLTCHRSQPTSPSKCPNLTIADRHHPLAITAVTKGRTAQWRITGEDIAFRFGPTAASCGGCWRRIGG